MTTTHEQLVAELTARWPEHRVAPSLNRMQALMSLLGEPQRAFPVIHITGTNGKGSTAIMIEALLRALGLRTGRFSSPHLTDVTERIAIDGKPISRQRFGEIWADIEPYVKMVDDQQLAADGDAEPGVPMTFFEVITSMAYAAFADAPVDVAVVEVGLGGTWDATNVADGQVAVIMPIDLDHTHLLGSTLAEIASEKAGIIKTGATAVLAGQKAEAAQVLLERCVQVGALPVREGVDFGLLDRQPAVGGQIIRVETVEGPVGDLMLPLYGEHMARNAAVAVAAVETFLGGKPIKPSLIEEAFSQVEAPGRLELVRQTPPIVLEGAHNPAAAEVAARTMHEAYAMDPLIGIVAMMGDKDVEAVLRIWEPLMNRIICTQVASTSRGLPAQELGELAINIFGGDRVMVIPSMSDAIEMATMLADGEMGNPGVLLTGSVIAVGEARTMLVGDSTLDEEVVDWDAEDHGGAVPEHLVPGHFHPDHADDELADVDTDTVNPTGDDQEGDA